MSKPKKRSDYAKPAPPKRETRKQRHQKRREQGK